MMMDFCHGSQDIDVFQNMVGLNVRSSEYVKDIGRIVTDTSFSGVSDADQVAGTLHMGTKSVSSALL